MRPQGKSSWEGTHTDTWQRRRSDEGSGKRKRITSAGWRCVSGETNTDSFLNTKLILVPNMYPVLLTQCLKWIFPSFPIPFIHLFYSKFRCLYLQEDLSDSLRLSFSAITFSMGCLCSSTGPVSLSLLVNTVWSKSRNCALSGFVPRQPHRVQDCGRHSSCYPISIL